MNPASRLNSFSERRVTTLLIGVTTNTFEFKHFYVDGGAAHINPGPIAHDWM